MEYFRSWPFPAAVAVLALIAFARVNATYWLARGARAGAGRTRIRAMFDTPGYRRAERIVARWGAPAVTASFLTVGVQTMINLVAGATRMPLRWYLPAVGVGSLIWGVVYAGVGGVTWSVLSQVYHRSPALAVGLAAVLALAVAAFVVTRLRSASEPADDAGRTRSEPDPARR